MQLWVTEECMHPVCSVTQNKMGFLQRDRKSCVHLACHLSHEASNKLDLFLRWQNPIQIQRPDIFKTPITLLWWFCSWGLCLSLLRSGKNDQKCMWDVSTWKRERDGGRPRLLNSKDASRTSQEIPYPMFPSLILHQKVRIPACWGLELYTTWLSLPRQVKRTASETGPSSSDFLCLIFDQFNSSQKEMQHQYYIYRLQMPVLSHAWIQCHFFTRLKYLFPYIHFKHNIHQEKFSYKAEQRNHEIHQMKHSWIVPIKSSAQGILVASCATEIKPLSLEELYHSAILRLATYSSY